MPTELESRIALELIPGIGNKGIKQLISYCGSASQVFTSPKNRLLKIPGLGEKLVEIIRNSNTIKESERIISDARKAGVEIIHYTDRQYPKLLKQIPDAPNLLFKRGYGDINPSRNVAVVGTRKATAYGRQITDRIIDDLASLNTTIISGLAYGIDIQAHKACLKRNIPTIAILAGGIDRVYPSAHKKYAEQILENGAILSESFPGTKPDKHLFPIRNRIIAGMADATIIVEAAEKGGALITANIADSYNRAVFAIPGNVGNTYSNGTNRLISTQRALIYTGVEDLIYHLGWDNKIEPTREKPLPELTPEEEVIFKLLKEEGVALEIDTIAIKTQISINIVASLLLSLEFKNLVKSMPGKKFGLTKY